MVTGEEKGLMGRWNDAFERINQIYQTWENKNGINPFELKVLACLYPDAVINQKDIRDRCDIPKQTVSSVCSRLCRDGYAASKQDESDGRGRKIFLTDKGRRYAGRILSQVDELNASALRVMGKDEFSSFTKMMESYGASLRKVVSAEG